MVEYDRLLIVEDTPSLARTYQAHLKTLFKSIEIADTGAKALDMVSNHHPCCILLDLKLPDMDGLDLLDRWVSDALNVPIIIITANGSLGTAVDAMRRGAFDFVVKPTSKDRLKTTVQSAVETTQLKITVEPRQTKFDQTTFCDFIGRSLVMQGVYKTIEAAAPSKASIFVTGDTGTGKELAARAIHQLSPRRRASLVVLNCSAIPKNLLESEIFGHAKGSFTGATADRVGAAQIANGGTLFLDELGEMPIELQPKILRFTQTGEYMRVGDSTLRRTDIRIIAATNLDPIKAVQEGRLREDLYYRLNVIPIALPPLRDRGGDILLLAEDFLGRFARDENKTFSCFERCAEEWLVSHSWPGNVRELENLIQKIVVLHSGGKITRQMLPDPAPHPLPHEISQACTLDAVNTPSILSAQPPPDYGLEPLWLTEKRAIERAIALCRGNITAAADRLQINPSTIHRKRSNWESESPGEKGICLPLKP